MKNCSFLLVFLCATAGWADELPAPSEPVTALNSGSDYFLNPEIWSFLGHFTSGSDTVAMQLDTGPGASYFQDGQSHGARTQINPNRTFCKLIITTAGPQAPGQPIEIRRFAHLVLRDHAVTSRAVPGPTGRGQWVETVIPLDTSASANDDMPNTEGRFLPNLWGFVCESPQPLTVSQLLTTVGLHLYHNGVTPYHLVATVEGERRDARPVIVPEILHSPARNSMASRPALAASAL